MNVPTLCRCCLAQGLHKSLDTTFIWSNKKHQFVSEAYTKMLQECFNIVLSVSPEFGNGICDDCASSLRSATEFKRKVISSEQELLRRLAKKDDKAELVDVKREPDSDNDSDNCFLSDVRDRSIRSEIKLELEEQQLAKKRAVKKNRSRIKKEPEVDISDIVAKLRGTSTQISIKKTIRSRRREPYEGCERTKHLYNLMTILENSNAAPFKKPTLVGYSCGYCQRETYADPKDLREHIALTHKKERCNIYLRPDTEFLVHVDITDLKCTICGEQMQDLTVLKEHLVKKHDKSIYNDIKDHIFQFRLKSGDVYDCAMCSATYETFKMLKVHMNKHYSNYSCNKCDASFATKRSLKSHVASHIVGSFKCKYCDSVFSTSSKRYNHEKFKHLGTLNRNCPHCGETFGSYYQRNQHLIKAHNFDAKYKCNVCEKAFVIKSLLMMHIKRTHLMERNCQCAECGFRFFSKKALKAHMVKHTGEKNFVCSVCSKCYARKYTLREHMRIHNNDRRFKCDVCSMTFVQKCSLKSHLLSNHGISMPASDISCVDTVKEGQHTSNGIIKDMGLKK